MSTDDNEVLQEEVRRMLAPPETIYSLWVAELMHLIRDEGTIRQKTRAAEISLSYMSRIQENQWLREEPK
jgi:hypothetical protein